MKSEVSEISPVMVEVQVEVPWETVKKELDQTFRAVGRQARIKGFRPGKVPTQIIRKMFGPQVRQDVSGTVAAKALSDVVDEHDIQICAEPDYGDMDPVADNEPFKFAAKLEVRPSIDSVDFDGLEVWKDEEPVTDEDVDAAIKEQLERQAEYAAPEPERASADGDRVLIGYEVSIDGEERPEMSTEGNHIRLGSEGLLPEFQSGLMGVSVGDELDIAATFPDDHTSEDLQGKTATFKVKVKAIEEAKLPTLDDEWAKEQGHDSLDAMKTSVREDMADRRARVAKNDLRDQLVEALCEKNPVEVPPTMVKDQERRMVYEFAQFMQMAGGMGSGLGDGFFDDLSERAERRVRGGLLLAAVSRIEGLEISDEEKDAKFAELAEKSGKHVARVRAEYQGERLDELENQILNDKIMAFLEEKATVKAGKRPEKPKADKADADESAKDEG